MTEAARRLTLVDCLAIGINGVVGSGIYLLIQPLAQTAGPASVLGTALVHGKIRSYQVHPQKPRALLIVTVGLLIESQGLEDSCLVGGQRRGHHGGGAVTDMQGGDL